MKRLGINKGRYHGEGLEIAEYLREFHLAARTRGWTPERFATVAGFELFGYRRIPKGARRMVYLSTGVHGDEPGGPVAMRRLVEENHWPENAGIILCPCVNPTGFIANTRENKEGIDLNRDYRHLHTPEVRAHTQWLGRLPRFDFTLLLHEDWEADGYYLYELNWEGEPTPAERIIETVREMCPIQGDGTIDGLWECRGGIIRPHVRPEARPQWAEAIYLITNKTSHSITLEAPSDFPLEFRVEAHVRAVRTALRE